MFQYAHFHTHTDNNLYANIVNAPQRYNRNNNKLLIYVLCTKCIEEVVSSWNKYAIQNFKQIMHIS